MIYIKVKYVYFTSDILPTDVKTIIFYKKKEALFIKKNGIKFNYKSYFKCRLWL